MQRVANPYTWFRATLSTINTLDWHSWQESDLLATGLESAPTPTPQELVRQAGIEPTTFGLATRHSTD